jgi:hypothetical protein
MSDQSEPYLTRKQAVELVRAETGIPLTASAFDKASMRKIGRAPKPAAVYGRQHLYTRATILEFARSLLKPVPEAA